MACCSSALWPCRASVQSRKAEHVCHILYCQWCSTAWCPALFPLFVVVSCMHSCADWCAEALALSCANFIAHESAQSVGSPLHRLNLPQAQQTFFFTGPWHCVPFICRTAIIPSHPIPSHPTPHAALVPGQALQRVWPPGRPSHPATHIYAG